MVLLTLLSLGSASCRNQQLFRGSNFQENKEVVFPGEYSHSRSSAGAPPSVIARTSPPPPLRPWASPFTPSGRHVPSPPTPAEARNSSLPFAPLLPSHTNYTSKSLTYQFIALIGTVKQTLPSNGHSQPLTIAGCQNDEQTPRQLTKM